MTYRINKFDGTVLTDIVDGTIDQISTDLTLIGSDVSGYGELLNENFIHLLENFASTQVPANPITGQLWYDLAESVLKIYTGTQFTKVSGTILDNSPSLPVTNTGDLLINNGQLYFNDGTGIRLAGPIYNKSQGLSGLEVVTKDGYTVICLWVGTNLVGLISNVEFVTSSPIFTYTGKVNAGFTLLAPNLSNTTADITLNKVRLYNGQTIGTTMDIYNSGTNLVVDGGDIDVSGSRIMNVYPPTGLRDAMAIGDSKIYHSTASTSDAAIITELEILAPPAEYIIGIQAHVYCSAIPERRKYEIGATGWTGPIA